jgi:hypothetical protein
MDKPVVIVGFPTIARLISGRAVELEKVVLMPDDQFNNEHLKILYEIAKEVEVEE